MATYYVDFENGNDANNGLSFANRRKTYPAGTTLYGGDSVRIMASPAPTLVGSGYISPIRNTLRGGDGYVGTFYASTTVNQSYFLSYSAIVDGDIINIWQNYNNIGLNGTWRITKIGNNCYLDGYTAPLNTSYSNSGYFYKYTPSTIYLDTAVTKNIASTGSDIRSAWTASANVTTAKNSNWSFYSSGVDYTREGSIYDQIAITANFATGKAAYYPTGTLDLSAYQQVSFYIRITSGVQTVSNLSLRLCSDTTGDTTVNTITIPALYGSTSGPWIPVTVNLGSNLGSSIQSIALYVDSDQGAQTVQFSNIIACKASSSSDSLTLNSLVGLNTANDLFWYGVESISERIVILTSRGAYQKHSYYSNPGVYFSQSGSSINIYKREPINRLGSSTFDMQLNNPSSASTSNRVTVSGGWNTTDMSTQDGITFLDKGNGQYYGLYISYNNYYSFNSLGFVRYGNNLYLNVASYCQFTGNLYAIDAYNTNIGFYYSILLEGNANFISAGTQTSLSSGQTPLSANSYSPNFYVSGGYNAFDAQSVSGSNFNNIKCYYGMFNTFRFYNSSNNTISNLEVKYSGYNFGYNDAFSFNLSNGNIISNVITSHILYGLYFSSASGNIISNFNVVNDNLAPGYLPMNYSINNTSSTNNYILSGTTDRYINIQSGNIYTKSLEITSGTEYQISSGTYAYSKNHDNVAGVDKTFFSGGTFEKSTTYRKTASGYSWKFTITTSAYTSTSPAEIPLAKVAVQANSLVTLKLWVYRTGTGIVGGLRVKGGFVTGISSDVTSYGTGSANVWEEVTVTCTPTEDAVLDVRALAYWSGNTSHNVYIDDFSATQ
jgi:hypothetical protein